MLLIGTAFPVIGIFQTTGEVEWLLDSLMIGGDFHGKDDNILVYQMPDHAMGH